MDKRIEVLARIHHSMVNGIRNGKSEIPRAWLKERGLSVEATGACFNSGQMHHRKPDAFRSELISVGFMTESDVPTNAGQQAYTVFGNYAVLFPLKNEKGKVVNFYAMGIKNKKEGFMNSEGIYPCYPNANTKKLYIVSSVIEAATLLESKVLDNREAVMALFNGELMPQHEEAIKTISQLNEIVLIESVNE